jgi:quercetin dioxygenase-like cupin family protein
MKIARLADMKGGWFAGNFEPTLLRTGAFEAACKYYPAGAVEARHVHRVATEITLVASGSVRMNGHVIGAGGIVVLEPDEPADFEALEDTITMVVKVPSVPDDKYEAPAGNA